MGSSPCDPELAVTIQPHQGIGRRVDAVGVSFLRQHRLTAVRIPDARRVVVAGGHHGLPSGEKVALRTPLTHMAFQRPEIDAARLGIPDARRVVI